MSDSYEIKNVSGNLGLSGSGSHPITGAQIHHAINSVPHAGVDIPAYAGFGTPRMSVSETDYDYIRTKASNIQRSSFAGLGEAASTTLSLAIGDRFTLSYSGPDSFRVATGTPTIDATNKSQIRVGLIHPMQILSGLNVGPLIDLKDKFTETDNPLSAGKNLFQAYFQDRNEGISSFNVPQTLADLLDGIIEQTREYRGFDPAEAEMRMVLLNNLNAANPIFKRMIQNSGGATISREGALIRPQSLLREGFLNELSPIIFGQSFLNNFFQVLSNKFLLQTGYNDTGAPVIEPVQIPGAPWVEGDRQLDVNIQNISFPVGPVRATALARFGFTGQRIIQFYDETEDLQEVPITLLSAFHPSTPNDDLIGRIERQPIPSFFQQESYNEKTPDNTVLYDVLRKVESESADFFSPGVLQAFGSDNIVRHIGALQTAIAEVTHKQQDVLKTWAMAHYITRVLVGGTATITIPMMRNFEVGKVYRVRAQDKTLFQGRLATQSHKVHIEAKTGNASTTLQFDFILMEGVDLPQ